MIIGIDGGGTKTTGIVVDAQGTVLKMATVGPTNPNSSNEESILSELQKLFLQLLQGQGLSGEDLVFAGISGAESGGKKEWFKELLVNLLGDKPTITVDNDAITALYSETKGDPGIVCISGTGSIAFGVNEKLERGRVGGWGYLINDGYSGFTIGKNVLEYVFAKYDEGHEPCRLTEEVLEHFQVKEMSELVPLVYELGKTRDRIASLARVAVVRSNDGDGLCTSFIQGAARAMLKDINVLYEKLMKDTVRKDTIPIVLTGGIGQHAEALKDYLHSEARIAGLPFSFKRVALPPIVGTVYAAFRGSGEKASEDFINKFEGYFHI
ncbi:BadF/BadG/BcrA/BcrD ATPase family protein [Bacillus sp. LL01]|uniref:N-acetylglucosamine kinase n=1 Tax=Bacillus sp. LL01 TaxID=1665556 RepID=UPI00069D0971|nr:BadF/BadG/BcrA/BcrD ATPase family protein [Bacillus sp. LL01]